MDYGSTKFCPRCGETKPIEKFAVRNRAKGYRNTECNRCSYERAKERAAADPERYRQMRRKVQARYYSTHPERRVIRDEQRKARYYQNHESEMARMRDYYWRNVERERERAREKYRRKKAEGEGRSGGPPLKS